MKRVLQITALQSALRVFYCTERVSSRRLLL